MLLISSSKTNHRDLSVVTERNKEQKLKLRPSKVLEKGCAEGTGPYVGAIELDPARAGIRPSCHSLDDLPSLTSYKLPLNNDITFERYSLFSKNFP